jgi:hypothetical protein
MIFSFKYYLIVLTSHAKTEVKKGKERQKEKHHFDQKIVSSLLYLDTLTRLTCETVTIEIIIHKEVAFYSSTYLHIKG